MKKLVKLLFQAMICHGPCDYKSQAWPVFSSSRQLFFFPIFLKINIFENNQNCGGKLVLALCLVTLEQFLTIFSQYFQGVAYPEPPNPRYNRLFCIYWNLGEIDSKSKIWAS